MNIPTRVLCAVVLTAISISTGQTSSSRSVHADAENVRAPAQTITVSDTKVNDGGSRTLTDPSSIEGASADHLGSARREVLDSGKNVHGIQLSRVDDNEEPFLQDSTSSEEKFSHDLLKRLNVSNDKTANNSKFETYTDHLMHSKKIPNSDFDDTFKVLNRTDDIDATEIFNAPWQVKGRGRARKPAIGFRGHARNTNQSLSPGGKQLESAITSKYTGNHNTENKIRHVSQIFEDEALKITMGKRIPESSATNVGDSSLLAGAATHDYRCSPTESDCAVVIPRGRVVGKVGEPINVSCLLNPACTTESSTANLTFEETNVHIAVQEKLESHGTQSLTFTVPRPGTFTLRCVDLSNSDNVACYRQLRVGYPPLDVQNFDCVCHDYGNMNCWFDVPDNPVQLHFTNYSICVEDDGKCNTKSPTRVGKKHQTWSFVSCFAPPTGMNTLTFRITAHNSLGQSSFLHTIDFYSRVRLGDSGNVTVMPQKDPLSFIAKWNASSANLYFPVRARVNVTSEFASESLQTRSTAAVLKLPYYNVRYNVTVELQHDTPDALYWSTPMYKVFNTPAAPPPLPPVAAPGMFETPGSSSEPFSVSLFWLPVPRELQAGPGFHYLVNVATGSNNCPFRGHRRGNGFGDCEDLVQSLTTNDTYVVFKNLTRDESYSFRVYSVNDCHNRSELDARPTGECRSSESRPYYFSHADRAVPARPAFLTTLYYPDTKVMSLRWYPSDSRPTNFTVYYCTEDESPCKTGVRFLAVGNRTSLNISLDRSSRSLDRSSRSVDHNLRDFTGYRHDEPSSIPRFSVSADLSIQNTAVSSGLVWAACRARYTPGDSYAPPQLELLSATSNSALLAWKWRPDDRCPPFFVAGVVVQLCGLTCEDQLSVPAWNTSSRLRSLKSSRHYTARLKILYDDGREPTYSHPLFFTTRSRALLWWEVVLIVSVTLLLLGIAVIVFQFSHRSVSSSLKPPRVPDFNGLSSSIIFSQKSAHTSKTCVKHETLAAAVLSSQKPAVEVTTNEEQHSLLNPLQSNVEGTRTLNMTGGSDAAPQDASTAPKDDVLPEEKTELLNPQENLQEIPSYTTLELVSEDECEDLPSSIVEVSSGSEVQQDLDKYDNGYVLAQFGSPSAPTQNAEDRLHSQCIPYVAIGTPFSPSTRFAPSYVSLEHNPAEVQHHQQHCATFNYVTPEASPYVLASFIAPKKEQNLLDTEVYRNLNLCADAEQVDDNNKEPDNSVSDCPNIYPYVKSSYEQKSSYRYVQLPSSSASSFESIPDIDTSFNLESIWSDAIPASGTAVIKLGGTECSSQAPCMNASAVLPYIPYAKIFSFNSANINNTKNFTIDLSNLAAIGSYEAADSTVFPDEASKATNIITGVNVPGHGHSVFLTN